MHPSVAISATQEQLEDPLAYLPFSTISEYPKGSTIYDRESSTSLYLVMEGRVTVSRCPDSGRQVVVDIYQADDFFGESAFLNVPHCAEQAMALANTKVMSWTAPALTDLVLRRPQLAIALLQLLARRTTNLKERLEGFCGDTIGRRLARSLIRFSHRMGTAGEGGAVYIAAFTHELLARYVGTSREIITYYMNHFRRHGYLQYSRKIITVYPEALHRWLNREE
jgi:CRP/FNR family cyclic AMP-dependent transcriptional regulator